MNYMYSHMNHLIFTRICKVHNTLGGSLAGRQLHSTTTTKNVDCHFNCTQCQLKSKYVIIQYRISILYFFKFPIVDSYLATVAEYM